MAKKIIKIDGKEITIIKSENNDYISLTDMAKSQMQEAVIIKWFSLKSTIEYLGEWEVLYNPVFNYTDFGTIKNNAGSNAMLIQQQLSQAERLEKLNAIAISQMQSLVNNSSIKQLK